MADRSQPGLSHKAFVMSKTKNWSHSSKNGENVYLTDLTTIKLGSVDCSLEVVKAGQQDLS